MFSKKDFANSKGRKGIFCKAFGAGKPSREYHKNAICVEMMGLIGAGNNPMVGMTVAVAVAIEEASK